MFFSLFSFFSNAYYSYSFDRTVFAVNWYQPLTLIFHKRLIPQIQYSKKEGKHRNKRVFIKQVT